MPVRGRHREAPRRDRGHHGPSPLPDQPPGKDLVDQLAIERINAEIERRTNVVGILPNGAAALRLITAVCFEQHSEWSVSERRYLPQESMAQLKSESLPPTKVALAEVE